MRGGTTTILNWWCSSACPLTKSRSIGSDPKSFASHTAAPPACPPVTVVSWTLLPAILRLRGELADPDDLYAAGELSAGAHRIVRALAAAGGALDTGSLRRAASFPTGKEQRAAYLRAVAELDNHLLL